MAKYVSPFASLAAGKSSSSQGYSSPFLGLSSSGVSQHRKDLAKSAADDQIKQQAQAALDSKPKKGKSILSRVDDFLNAAGEESGTILAKTLTGIVGQAERIPTLARFEKPFLPSAADKFIENKIVKPTRGFSDRTVGHFDKTYLNPDEAITSKSPAGAKFGRVSGQIESTLGQLAAPGPKGIGIVSKGTKGVETAKTIKAAEELKKAGRVGDIGSTAMKGGGPYKNTKSPTFAETRGATVTSSKDSAARLREINKEQNSLRIQQTEVASKSKTIPSDVTIKMPEKTPSVGPSQIDVTNMAKDPAEKLRSRLTNQLISTTGLLSRHGKEGKALAEKVHSYNQTARDLSTKWFNAMPTFGKLSKDETSNFARATQGLEEAKNAKVAKAVEEWRAVSPEIRNQFIQHSGEEIGNVQNFFPHSIKPESLKRGSSSYNAAIKHLVDTGQVKTAGEAVNVLNFARRSGTKGNVLGSFKFAREYNLPENMYDTSKTAIANYLEGAAHSVAGAQHLGMDRAGIFHGANDLIGKVADRGGNADKVKQTFEQAMGLTQHSEAIGKASNAARSVQIFTKLGLGAITNAGQTVNTIVKNGFIDTAKGLGYLTTPKGRQFARETGAFTHGLISDLREMRGITGAAGKIGAPGFNNVEQFNRYLASVAGKFHAERLAKRGNAYSKTQLEKAGITGDVSRGLTREQQLKAGRYSSDKTQFIVAPHTLPGWSTSPVGKLVSQFQTFSYKQSDFVWNEIIKPLQQGNAMPLARLMAVLPAAYGLYAVKSKIRGTDTTNSNKVVQAWRAAGGGGTIENLVTGTASAKKYSSSGKEFAANEAAQVGGPTTGSLVETLGSIYGLSTGKPKAAKQQGLSLVPVVGSRLKNTYAPSGSESGRTIKAAPEVNKELNRLGYRLQDTNRKTGRAAQLDDKGYNKFIDGSSKLFGTRANKALADPEYISLSDEDKKNTMSNILSQSRTDVLDLLVGKAKRSSTPRYKNYQ